MKDTLPDPANPSQVVIQQDEIDAHEDTVREFLRRVVSTESSQALLTDLSELSDFCPSGLPREVLDRADGWPAVCAAWDAWVIERASRSYKIRLERTTVRMIDVARQIDAVMVAAAAPELH